MPLSQKQKKCAPLLQDAIDCSLFCVIFILWHWSTMYLFSLFTQTEMETGESTSDNIIRNSQKSSLNEGPSWHWVLVRINLSIPIEAILNIVQPIIMGLMFEYFIRILWQRHQVIDYFWEKSESNIIVIPKIMFHRKGTYMVLYTICMLCWYTMV